MNEPKLQAKMAFLNRWRKVIFLLLPVLGLGVILIARPGNQEVRQPVAFSHQVHLAHQIDCSTCHEGALQAAQAELPGVRLCLVCHEPAQGGNPTFARLGNFAASGEEIHWVKMSGFRKEAAVFFSHKRHGKAGIRCETCHGNISSSPRGVPRIPASMGECLECHKMRGASTDCLTCHI